MRYLFAFLVIVTSFNCNYSFAHLDRMKSMDHSRNSHMNEKKVISITIKTINKMTFKDLGYEAGKLPSSWEIINKADVNIVNVHEGSYVVIATNLQVKQTLYFRIDDDGDVVAVSENKGF